MSAAEPERARRPLLKRISPRRWEILTGLVAPVLLLGALLSGEAILRIQQYQAFGPNQAVETEIEESVWEVAGNRRRPRPGAQMGDIAFNAAGFRGETAAQAKPNGLIRIGFFGSSTTMDPYVASERETWPAVATAALREAYPKCRIEYFNAGVIGYDLGASRARFLDDAQPYKPDVAVFLLNDVSSRARAQLNARGVNAKGFEPSWFANESILWLKLEKNWAAERLKRIAARRDKSYRIDLDALDAGLRGDLDDLYAAVSATGAMPVFVGNAPSIRREQPLSTQVEKSISRVLYMPNVFIGDITESFYSYNATLKAAAAKFDFPYVETIAQMPDGDAYYVDSSHTTPRGSRIFGTIVGKSLSADPRVKALLHERGGGCD